MHFEFTPADAPDPADPEVQVALDDSKTALAQRMHASGESANTIASTLGVSRATVYRVLAEDLHHD